MEFAFTLLARFWKPLLIGVALIGLYFGAVGIKHAYDDGKRAEGAKPVQEMHDAYVKAARERTTAITLAWDAKRIEAETAGKVAQDAIAERIAAARRAAATLLPAVAAAVVPADVVRLLNDAGAANDPAPIAGPPAEPARAVAAVPVPADPPGEESNFGLIVETWRTARVLYDACRERVDQITAFYDSLRAAQVPEP